MSDIATQLNNVLTRDGILGPTSAFKLIDGNVSVPGLGFNSEPGLGLYRINTSILGFAAAGKQTIVNDASSAGTVITSLYPRSVGQAEVRLNSDIYGTADTTVLRLAQAPAGGIIQSLAVGAGAAKPILYTASAHSFTGPVISEPNSLSSRFIADRALDVAGIGSFDMTTTDSLRFRLQYGAGGGETSNAGNFSIYRYQNDGTTSENAFNIDRADGVVSMQRQLQVGTAQTAGQTSLIVTRQSQFGEQVGITASGVALNASAGSISASLGFIWNTANTWGLSSAGFRSSGTTRITDVINGSSVGVPQTLQALHDPGVSASLLFVCNANSFTMASTGTGSSLGGWVATSDKRLKPNSVRITNALDKVRRLNGYTFDRPDMAGMDGVIPRKAGYYAQELMEVLPECVITAKDEMGTLSVDHNGPIGLLIEAVKELHDLVIH